MVSEKSEKAFVSLARAGYAARGVVYLIVGGLAALAAWGAGGETTDPKGALATLMDKPFGKTLLVLIGVGLLGFALWRLVEAIWDPDGRGSDAKGLAARAGYLGGGLANVGLAFFAVGLAFPGMFGSSGSDAAFHSGTAGDAAAQDWTARLLALPHGRWLVFAVGAVVVCVGLAQGWRAWKADFMRELSPDPDVRRWVRPLGRFGFAARGVVFAIVGLFLLAAAWQARSGQARGIGGALQALGEQPYGDWLLGVVALGLAAFAVFSVVEAFYRRIVPPGELSS